MMIYVLYYVIFINLFSFAIYGIDKYRAVRQKYRIPEVQLIFAAFLGGALGAWLGMIVFHHKTRKPKFLLVPLFLVIQLICAAILLFTDKK